MHGFTTMDNHPGSPLPNWVYFPQDKNMDDLKQSFLLTMEMEVKSRDDQIDRLKELLNRAVRERNRAQKKCQRVLLEKLFLQQQLQLQQDEPARFSGSGSDCECDCDESSIVSDPERPLPEKGKLLQAVIKAGPLLQTLLLAGPLPQWRHPPPPLDTNQIPPFPDCGTVNRKRSLLFSDYRDLKHQRIPIIQ